MAITLTITDGTLSVNLANIARLCLLSGSEMSISSAGDTQETWSVMWASGITTDQVASDVQDLTQLFLKAATHYRKAYIDRAVWLTFKPDNATNTQYAKVKAGQFGAVDWRSIEGRDTAFGYLTLTRESAWRTVAPDGTAGSSEVSSATLYNKSDADGDNWTDITSRGNDIPAKLVITTNNDAAWDNLIIGMKRRPSASDLNNFNPHFNPTDQDSALAETADATAPGNFRIDSTATSTVSWKIDDTTLPYYVGNYAIYCKAYLTGSGAWTATYSDDYQTGSAVSISSSSTDNLVYLGDFAIPAVELNDFVTLATSSDLQINVVMTEVSGTATCRFYGMWLVPLDVPLYHIRCLTNTIIPTRSMVHDGVNEISYQIETTGGAAAYDRPLAPGGRYLQSIGGEVNRLFFYAWEGTDYQHEDTLTVDVAVVDTFAGMRGAA